MSAPICSPVFGKTWRMSVIVRVGVAAAAGGVGTFVGWGVFNPEPDMAVDVHGGGEEFGGEIDDSSSLEEDIEPVGGGGVLGCWNNTLGY